MAAAAAAAAATEEEVRMEVEAVQAVYGDDCRVIQGFPPHLVVHIRPRTADDSSLQFVEVFLGIRCSTQYPQEPPCVYAAETKGLDENRHSYLISSIQQKAGELSSCLMLVALCEEAVEILSNMNHPEGNCPLCLYPMITEDQNGGSLPFMKLMSCYHCFHSECIIRWWIWLQEQNDTRAESNASTMAGGQRVPTSSEMHASVNDRKGNCPVCRNLFDEKDIEHVLDLLGESSFQLGLAALDVNKEKEGLLYSEAENRRRKQYESLLNLQQERNGLIEPKKDLVILPGMYVPLPPPPASNTTSTEGGRAMDEDVPSCSAVKTSMDTSTSHDNATRNKQKNPGGRRKNKAHGSRKQQPQSLRRQWLRKEVGSPEQ